MPSCPHCGAAVAAFTALQAEQMTIIFDLDDNTPMSAYRSIGKVVQNFHQLTIRGFARRGYIAKLRNVTTPDLRYIEVWECGLTDAGRQAFNESA